MDEESTRENKINHMLEKSGWSTDDRTSEGTYKTEIKTSSMDVGQKEGFADYILYDENMNPIAVIEAKSDEKPSIGNLQQAKRYAKTLEEHTPHRTNSGHIPFVYATNGDEIWFQDLREKAPQKKQIGAFHSLDTLHKKLWFDYNEIHETLDSYDTKKFDGKLWDNQKEGIENIESAIRKCKRKILVQMATGTGKTRMAMAQTYRLLESQHVDKVLFIPNTTHLAEQSKGSFENYEMNGKMFKDFYSVTNFKEDENPYVGDVVVTTLQKMYREINRDDKNLDPSTFDLIITDECHEFIYNKYGDVINYFDSIVLGLTATPSERTIGYFGEPVYKYGYEDGVSDGKIVPFNKIDHIKTKITMDGVEKNGRVYPSTALGTEITVPSTHRTAAQYLRDDMSNDDEITLVFAKNDKHARHIVNDFQEVFSDKPEDYIQRITYTVRDSNGVIKRLESTDHNPKIGVTVDMVSTGVDVRPLENIVFLRPVKSPVLYNQMIGRATRQYTFDDGREKSSFDVYDFVGLRDYFEDVPPFNTKTYEGSKTDDGESTESESSNLEVVYKKDEYISSEVVFPTKSGEELNREEYRERFEEYVKSNIDSNDVFRKVVEQDPSKDDIEELEKILRSTEEMFVLDRLKEAYEINSGTVLDFVYSVISDSDEIMLKSERIQVAKNTLYENYRLSEKEKKWIDLIANFRNNSSGSVKKKDFTYPPLCSEGGWKSAVSDFGGSERLEMILESFEEVQRDPPVNKINNKENI